MPGRSSPLVTDEIYHVYNRGINRQPTFLNKRDYERGIQTISYYRLANLPLSLSKFLRLDQTKKNYIREIIKKCKELEEILAYCLMPNHFHFLLKQKKDNGIRKFMSNFQNSYTRFFNTKGQRDGSLFLNQFKTVRVETDEQLLHLSRYIHLNPYTNYVVKSYTDLLTYPWSSITEYLDNKSGFVNRSLIEGFFKNSEEHKKFIIDQADYQQELKLIEHLTLE